MENGLAVIGIFILFIAISYAGLIIFFTTGWYKVSFIPNVTRSGKRVSVIVAMRDEEKNVALLLEDLTGQNFPVELTEIILVDDHSKDGTFRVVEEFILKHNRPDIIFIKNEDENLNGKKAALELGINRAQGEIILTTDADCRAGKDWIGSLMAGFSDESVQIVFGFVAYSGLNSTADHFQALEFAGLVASGAGAAGAGHPFICNGANLAYRKTAFQTVGGFSGNEDFLSGDDVFLLHKIKKHFGRKTIVFSKDKRSVVTTFPAPGIGAFIRQRIRWASKSKGYRDFLSVLTALTVFSFSLALLSSLVLGLINPVFFIVTAGLVALKMMVDYPLLLGITNFSGNKNSLKRYWFFQLIYPFYIVTTGILSLFNRKSW